MNAEAPEFALPKRYNGRVKTFNFQKGFGFIECEETMALYARDVFLHQRQAIESGLKQGMACQFEVEVNNKGQPQARNVQAASSPLGEMPYSPPWSSPYGAPYSNMGGPWWPEAPAGYGESMGGEHTRYQLLEHIKQVPDPRQLQSLLSNYAASFQKDHIFAVAALYRLATLQAWSQPGQQPLSAAPFLSCIFAFEPELKNFSPSEACQVVWSFNKLEASSGKERAFAMKLCQVVSDDSSDIRCGYKKFQPPEMVSFMQELNGLIRNSSDDALIAEVIDKYSEWGLGESKSSSESEPRWAQRDVEVWANYLAGGPQNSSMQQHGMPAPGMHPAAWQQQQQMQQQQMQQQQMQQQQQQQQQQYGGCRGPFGGCPQQAAMGGGPASSWRGPGMSGPGHSGPPHKKGGGYQQQMCGSGGPGGKGGSTYGGKGPHGPPGGKGQYRKGR